MSKMKQYKLINNQTGEEHLCDKVTIDDFDYYINSEIILLGDYYINLMADGNKIEHFKEKEDWDLIGICHSKKIIACTNPNIDIPKIVDEVTQLALKEVQSISKKQFLSLGTLTNIGEGIIIGYNKSQKTHPFSEEHMMNFGEYCADYDYRIFGSKSIEELFKLWKSQKPKVIYFE